MGYGLVNACFGSLSPDQVEERQPDGMLDDEGRYAEKARKRAFSRASNRLAGTVTP